MSVLFTDDHACQRMRRLENTEGEWNMDSVPQRRFVCYAYDQNGTRLRYQVRAELNGRPQFRWSDVINKRVCWQYFNETLNTAMIRYGEDEYGVAGNPALIFYCDDPEQPPFEPENAPTGGLVEINESA
jgi:hypothetical protein